MAIQAKKPTLCLSIHEDFSEKIKHPYFFAAQYNENNLEFIVSDFLERVKNEPLNQRFNLFLSPRQVGKLERLAKAKGLNKSAYLRTIIEQD